MTESAYEPVYVGLRSFNPESVQFATIEALKDLGYEPDEKTGDEYCVAEAKLKAGGEVYEVTCWWAAARETQIAAPTKFAPPEQAKEMGILVTGGNPTLAEIQAEQIADLVDNLLAELEKSTNESPN